MNRCQKATRLDVSPMMTNGLACLSANVTMDVMADDRMTGRTLAMVEARPKGRYNHFRALPQVIGRLSVPGGQESARARRTWWTSPSGAERKSISVGRVIPPFRVPILA